MRQAPRSGRSPNRLQERAGGGPDFPAVNRYDHPRDFVGYGATPPDAKWPGGARVAVQIVMNYEEGSEYAIGEGDGVSETYLTEAPGATLGPGKRDLIVESIYEYGSRAGFWRLIR